MLRHPCAAQAGFIAGFITFKGFADHASTASVAVKDAVGYDIESKILTCFAGLWAMPEYEVTIWVIHVMYVIYM